MLLEARERRRRRRPTSVAGASANSRRACLRVWSIVASGVAREPGRVASTAKSESPASVVAGDEDQRRGVAVDDEALVRRSSVQASSRLRRRSS